MSVVWWSDGDEQKPNSDFPIKKRIITELFIDAKQKLYGTQGIDQEWSEDLWERGERKLASDGQNRWEWKPIMAACLNWSILGRNEN